MASAERPACRGPFFQELGESNEGLCEGFADHFFALLPKGLGVGGIEGVATDAFSHQAYGLVVWDNGADMAVFAELRADFFCGSDDGRPDGCGSALWDRLPLEGWVALSFGLLHDLLDHGVDVGRIHVAGKLGHDSSGVDCCGADVAVLVAAVELDGKEDVDGLRAAIGDEGVVRCGFEVGVLEVHIGEAMAR